MLSDPATDAFGSYGVINYTNNTAIGISTKSAHPGHLRISGFDPADSTLAGSFRFDLYNWEGAKTTFAGTFRLRHP